MSTVLPAMPADPCDRMIIAVHVYYVPVITTDPLFVRYRITVIS